MGETGQKHNDIDTRDKRQISDDPGPFGIQGRIIEGDHMAQNPDSAKFEGMINGELKCPTFSSPLVKLRDGSDPIAVQGSVYGTLFLPKGIPIEDSDQARNWIQAEVSLILELKTVTDDPEQISITGRLDDNMEIKSSQVAQLASITDFDEVPVYGWLYGELILTAKARNARDGL